MKIRQTRLWILLVICSLSMMVSADSLIKLQPKRLPDLNIPRISHSTFIINGELTVVGGHTSGFVPTKTAEYLKDDCGVSGVMFGTTKKANAYNTAKMLTEMFDE